MSTFLRYRTLANRVIGVLGRSSSWAAAALLCGCASYHALPLMDDGGSASTLVEHKERSGLHVAVSNLAAKRTVEKHFGRDLPAFGFVPVQLLLELDAQSNDAFNVRREELELVLQDGTRLEAVHPLDVVREVSFSHWRTFFGFLLLVPGPFVASSVSSANSELEEDYVKKSMRSVRVSPNMRSYRGVVFFRLPEDAAGDLSLEDAFVEVKAYMEGNKHEGNGLGRKLEIPVHLTE